MLDSKLEVCKSIKKISLYSISPKNNQIYIIISLSLK